MTAVEQLSARRSLALATLLLVLFLTFLDTTIVSVTLGDMEADLSAGVIPLQWVINAYALVFASLMLTLGSLGDRYGRRRIMLVGIVVFCLGSVMCAVAPSVAWVIAGRGVMGVGAAASEPGTLSLIRQLYPESAERARALGAWSAVSGLALALGPVIGGLLIGLAGWRAVFWFNLALSVVLLAAVAWLIPESRDPQAGHVDVAGFALGTVGIGAVIYAVISGENNGYRTSWVVVLFVVGAAALLAFPSVELRVKAPMLDVRYLRRPIVSSALFAAFAVYLGVFALFFLTALYIDVGLQRSGWELAGLFAPMAAAIVLGGLVAGRWVARAGSRVPMVVGCFLGAVGMLIARLVLRGLQIPGCQPSIHGCIAHEQPYALAFVLVSFAVAGFGFGITVVPLTSAVLSHIPGRLSGMAASATNTARQLGAVTGVAALGAIVNASLVNEVVNQTQGLYVGSRATVLAILETGQGADASQFINNIPPNYIIAFRSGLQTSLVVAFVVIALAGAVAWFIPEPAVEEA